MWSMEHHEREDEGATADIDLRKPQKRRGYSRRLTLETGSGVRSRFTAIPLASVGLPDRSYHPAIGPFECRGSDRGVRSAPSLSSSRRAFKY